MFDDILVWGQNIDMVLPLRAKGSYTAWFLCAFRDLMAVEGMYIARWGRHTSCVIVFVYRIVGSQRPRSSDTEFHPGGFVMYPLK